jgi:hypothetical protein
MRLFKSQEEREMLAEALDDDATWDGLIDMSYSVHELRAKCEIEPLKTPFTDAQVEKIRLLETEAGELRDKLLGRAVTHSSALGAGDSA